MIKLLSAALLLTVTVNSQALTQFDDKAYREATRLLREHKYKEAHLKLEEAYDLKDKSVSPTVIYSDCLALIGMKRYEDVRVLLKYNLNVRELWPPSRDKGLWTTEDMNLTWCYAAASTQYYRQTYDALDERQKQQILEDINAIKDRLSSLSYDPARIEKLTTTVAKEKSDRAKMRFQQSFQIALSYLSWEDMARFFGPQLSSSGHAQVLTPCVGGSATWRNDSYAFVGGGCYGIGNAHAQIGASDFDSTATVQAISLFAKALRQLGDSQNGFGLQTGILNREITAHTATNQIYHASHLDFELMAVGKLQFKTFFFDFAGGTLITQPSAIWSLELGINL